MGFAFFIRFKEYFGLYLCDFVYFSSLIMYNESIDTVCGTTTSRFDIYERNMPKYEQKV